MSHVFIKNTAIHSTKEDLYELLVSTIKNNLLEYNYEKIRTAYEFACAAHNGKKRYSGDEYVTHPINVAILLSEIRASEEAVIAGLLHDVIFEKTNMSIEEVKNEFSEKVSNIITSVTRFDGTDELVDKDVIMVKLADRLHNMRTIEFIDEAHWKEKAEETLDIFLPIAAKLKNEKLIAELKDLSVKYI